MPNSNAEKTDFSQRPVRIEHDGPQGVGLSEWEEMDPATLASGTPLQRGHLYDEVPEIGYLAGVWDCTAFDDKPGPYSVDEYMFLLEGKVIMGLPDGTEITEKAGEAFVLPQGLQCQWKMPGYVRKIFMIAENKGSGSAKNPSLHRVTKPSLTQPESNDEVWSERISFCNADGKMRVAQVHYATAFTGKQHMNCVRLITVLEGSVNIAGGAFKVGDSFYCHPELEAEWTIAAGTSWIEARYLRDG